MKCRGTRDERVEHREISRNQFGLISKTLINSCRLLAGKFSVEIERRLLCIVRYELFSKMFSGSLVLNMINEMKRVTNDRAKMN